MDRNTYKSRLNLIAKSISKQGADCLVSVKPANVTWLTGFTGQDSWLIVFPRFAALITDSRYTEQALAQSPYCKIIDRKGSIVNAAAEIITKYKAKIAAVEKSIFLADFQSLKKNLRCRLKPAEQIIESARRTKDKMEVSAIAGAAKIAAKAFEKTMRQIKPQMTENTIAGMLDFEIRKAGGTNSFETIVAFGPNASRPHHQPTSRKLKKNDNILVDFGVRLNGYCCDLTRCFSIAKSSALFNKVYNVVKQSQTAAIKMLKAGIEIKAVDAAAREIIKKAGLPVYGHGTGHGLGLEVHELPIVSGKTKGKLETGDCITIEPAVYIPGHLGVRIEDDCLITQNGCIILTAGCPKI